MTTVKKIVGGIVWLCVLCLMVLFLAGCAFSVGARNYCWPSYCSVVSQSSHMVVYNYEQPRVVYQRAPVQRVIHVYAHTYSKPHYGHYSGYNKTPNSKGRPGKHKRQHRHH